MLNYVCNDVITAAAVFNFHRIEKVEREINRTNGVSDGQNEGEGRKGVLVRKNFLLTDPNLVIHLRFQCRNNNV